MHIGQHGTYRVPHEHHGKTAVGKETVKDKDGKDIERDVVVHGSVHHREMTEFFAMVGRHHPAHKDAGGKEHREKVDLCLIVPDKRELVWVHGVLEGETHGQFEPAD